MKRRKLVAAGLCLIFVFITACGMIGSSGSSGQTEEELLAQLKEKLEEGDHVDTRDEDGQTSLMWAAAMNSLKIAKLMIENGADINAKDKNGQTPLIYAAMKNSLDVAKLLLETGADVEVKDTFTLTALMWAEVKRHDKMIELLRKHREQ
ncbi:MAG: ankyrin repeat domain-containing protein [Deltaproteobacteria bacterium]|nr:ankyrin repeat domain-containing protein [Deltaproteobacteria bacterium]